MGWTLDCFEPPHPPTSAHMPQDLAALGKAHDFDVIYDMNGRELADTKPLADAYKGRVRGWTDAS